MGVNVGIEMGEIQQIVRENCKSCNKRGVSCPKGLQLLGIYCLHAVNAGTVDSLKARLDTHGASGDLRRSVYQI